MRSKRLDRIPLKHRKDVESQIRSLLKILQEQRESRGFTQEELAERLDISVRTLQFIEQGRRFPSIPMLFYLAKLLKITVKFEK